MDLKSKILIIGVGNEFCSDDGAGLAVARRVQAAAGIPVREESGEGASLLDAWQGTETVILCDAAHAGAAPGTVFRLDPLAQPLPAGMFRFSTHAFGVAEAIALGRALGRVPARMIVYGIQGAGFEPGVGLSPAVDAAADEVVRAVLADLGVARATDAEASYA